jgi:hypothetical protein
MHIAKKEAKKEKSLAIMFQSLQQQYKHHLENTSSPSSPKEMLLRK